MAHKANHTSVPTTAGSTAISSGASIHSSCGSERSCLVLYEARPQHQSLLNDLQLRLPSLHLTHFSFKSASGTGSRSTCQTLAYPKARKEPNGMDSRWPPWEPRAPAHPLGCDVPRTGFGPRTLSKSSISELSASSQDFEVAVGRAEP